MVINYENNRFLKVENNCNFELIWKLTIEK